MVRVDLDGIVHGTHMQIGVSVLFKSNQSDIKPISWQAVPMLCQRWHSALDCISSLVSMKPQGPVTYVSKILFTFC